jgi:hypothetical protein
MPVAVRNNVLAKIELNIVRRTQFHGERTGATLKPWTRIIAQAAFLYAV